MGFDVSHERREESVMTKPRVLISHPHIPLRAASSLNHKSHRNYKDQYTALPPLTKEQKHLKILLLEPLFPSEVIWGSLNADRGFIPPIGVISIYTFLKHRGYNVEFIDTQFGDYTEKSLFKLLQEKKYDVIGISVFTSSADYSFSTAAMVRKALPQVIIIFGNVHASSQPELTLHQCQEVDFIVKHEGEFTLDELLRSLSGDIDKPLKEIVGLAFRENGKIVETANRPFISDLEILPLGIYSDLDLTRYVPHPTHYVVLPNYPVTTQ